MYFRIHSIKESSRKADFALPSWMYRYCSKEFLLRLSNTSNSGIKPDLYRLIIKSSLTANSLCRFFSVSLMFFGRFRKSSYRSCVTGTVVHSSVRTDLKYSSTDRALSTKRHRVKSPLFLPWILERLASARAFPPLLNFSADSKSHSGFFALRRALFRVLCRFTSLFPLQLPLLNLGTRDRNNLCRQTLKPLEWSLGFWWRVGGFHKRHVTTLCQGLQSRSSSEVFDLVVGSFSLNVLPVCNRKQQKGD